MARIINASGKPYTTKAGEWSVLVHDMEYEYPERAPEVERVLRRVARSRKADALFVMHFHAINASTRKGDLLDTLYEAANRTLSEWLNRKTH